MAKKTDHDTTDTDASAGTTPPEAAASGVSGGSGGSGGAGGGFDLADLPLPVESFTDVRVMGGFVRVYPITDAHVRAMREQVPGGGPTEGERNGSGEVAAAYRKDVSARVERQARRRDALCVLISARGEHGVRHGGVSWSEDRDRAWCEAAADALLERLDAGTLATLIDAATGMSPLMGSDRRFIGDAETAGN